jgi:hypothetical protein
LSRRAPIRRCTRASFRDLFPVAAADAGFAKVGLRLAFSVLDGLAIGRLIDTADDDLDEVLEVFNAMTAVYFPESPGDAP